MSAFIFWFAVPGGNSVIDDSGFYRIVFSIVRVVKMLINVNWCLQLCIKGEFRLTVGHRYFSIAFAYCFLNLNQTMLTNRDCFETFLDSFPFQLLVCYCLCLITHWISVVLLMKGPPRAIRQNHDRIVTDQASWLFGKYQWHVLVISSVFADVGMGTQPLAFHPLIQPPTRHHFILYLVTGATFPSFKNKSLFFWLCLWALFFFLLISVFNSY